MPVRGVPGKSCSRLLAYLLAVEQMKTPSGLGRTASRMQQKTMA
jgi:hypothetical protein